ncbi:MAG: YhcH/YjgK/YiaL family protein [Alistipes sp.]|nr:YhcH/YjgK/YiaL family protein [Candidatus Alistipes equi]
MIIDKIENAEKYYALGEGIRTAFEFVKKTNLTSLKPGRTTIDGDAIFLNIDLSQMRSKEEALLEVHNKYIDIQIPLECESGYESFGWSSRSVLEKPQGEFSNQRDIQFFLDTPQTIFRIPKGCFAIFFAEDAHAPLIGQGEIKKAIFKVISK